MELKYYQVSINDWGYAGTKLRTKCQSTMGRPLRSDRSLVSLKEKNERKWMNGYEKENKNSWNT